MLLLPITCIFLTNIRIGEKMPDMMLDLKTRKACLKGGLKVGARNIPTLGIFRRVERQRYEPLKFCGYKICCCFVCWCAGR